MSHCPQIPGRTETAIWLLPFWQLPAGETSHLYKWPSPLPSLSSTILKPAQDLSGVLLSALPLTFQLSAPVQDLNFRPTVALDSHSEASRGLLTLLRLLNFF